MFKRILHIFVFLSVLAGMFASQPIVPAHAAGIIYIKANAAGSNNGSSWANAYTSLQSALAVAASGDQIWVATGTYKPTTNTDRAISFTLKNGVAIYGGFAGTETMLGQRDPSTNLSILSGDIGTLGDSSDNSYHVVNGGGTNNTALLDGFTITAGNADFFGGGIYNANSSPTLSNLILSANSAPTNGGGMFNDNSSPTLTNVTFSGNTSQYGGGMYNITSSPTLTNVTLSGNSASNSGGGLFNANSNPTLTDATFSSNSANGAGGGGGMYNLNSNPSLTHITFSNNSASVASGGGMNNSNSSPTLTDVTFNGNSASTGGGMNNGNNSSPILTNVTFLNNSASNGGGMASGSSPSLTNVTFTSNSASAFGGGMSLNGSTASLTHVTFNNNTSGSIGGGIYNINGSPTLTDVTFSSNSALGGGGMYNDLNSSPTLTSATFSGNSASNSGGGMMNGNGSSPTLSNVMFSNNSAVNQGGGMVNFNNSSPILENVTFNSNLTSGPTNGSNGGGGMLNSNNSNPSLTNITFSENSATEFGGGMHNNNSNPSLTNVTFSNNSASSNGGGIYNLNSSPTLTNVTISDNSATSGGGMFNNGSNPVITNSVLYNNSGGEISGAGTPVVTYSIVQGGYSGTGNLDADPMLSPLADNGGFTQTLALGLGSPAIDSGNGATCASHDQRGVVRPQGWGCDRGAFERYFEVLSITRNDPSPTASQTVIFTVTFSQVANFVDANDFALVTTSVTGASITNVSNVDDNHFEVTVNTGTGDGTIRLDFINIGHVENDWGQFPGIGLESGDFTSGESYTIDKTLEISSSGPQDGWILESTETSGKGGTKNNTATTFNLGDDAARKQYRAILSFDTSSIPVDAVITQVTLKVKRSGVSGGGNPVSIFKGFMVDIKKGAFGTSALALGDFKVKASKTLGPFSLAPSGGWYSLNLTPGSNQINKTGLTQIRLRFKLDDNNNSIANILKIYSGNAGAANRPQLIVEYYVP